MMNIPTNFDPKPGDRVKHEGPPGHTYVYVWVECPGCSESRWVQLSTSKRPGFDGICKTCYIKRIKEGGWTYW